MFTWLCLYTACINWWVVCKLQFSSNCVLINCILYIHMNFDLNRVIKFQLIGEKIRTGSSYTGTSFAYLIVCFNWQLNSSRNGQAPGSWNILDFSIKYNYLQIIYLPSVVTEFSSTLDNRKTTLSKPYNSLHFHY